MSNNEFKKYQMSISEKILMWLTNYELGGSITDSVRLVEYTAIDRLAHLLMISHDGDSAMNQDFLFTITMDPITEIELKKCLLRRKRLILKHIALRGYFDGSHLYQLYLQYLPDELTDEEKKMLLDNYIAMIEDKVGPSLAEQKRIRLEERFKQQGNSVK